jgi:hypothetical protein
MRFLYVQDLLDTTVRKFFPLRAVLETGRGREELIRAQSAVAKEAQSAFLAVARSQFAHKEFALAARCLNPVCEYSCLFDGTKGRLAFIYPATLSMLASIHALKPSLRAAGQAGSSSAADFRALEDANSDGAFV